MTSSEVKLVDHSCHCMSMSPNSTLSPYIFIGIYLTNTCIRKMVFFSSQNLLFRIAESPFKASQSIRSHYSKEGRWGLGGGIYI